MVAEAYWQMQLGETGGMVFISKLGVVEHITAPLQVQSVVMRN